MWKICAPRPKVTQPLSCTYTAQGYDPIYRGHVIILDQFSNSSTHLGHECSAIQPPSIIYRKQKWEDAVTSMSQTVKLT